MPSESCSALVLRKTKLAETDLVITMLQTDGSLIRAVAKGVRKPGSRFGARLEPASAVDLLVSTGRSLGIIQEARCTVTNEACRADLEHETGTSVILEALSKISQEGDPLPRLYDLSLAALQALGAASPTSVPLITAAHLIKAVSMVGFRPSLNVCVRCGSPISQAIPCPSSARMPFSFSDGGCVCAACSVAGDIVTIDRKVVDGLSLLIVSRFEDILSFDADSTRGLELLDFVQTWLLVQLDIRLKSLSFMIACGLYEEGALPA